MFNLEVNPVVTHSWSRTHSGQTNYCLVEQHITYKFNNKYAVRLSPDNIRKELLPFEVEALPKKSVELSFDYLENDTMSVNNVATKDYDYFLVSFVNGTKIICKNYQELIKIIGLEANKQKTEQIF